MKNTTNNNKKKYNSPEIEQINIDSEISLSLESNVNDNPFGGPNESYMLNGQTALNPIA